MNRLGWRRFLWMTLVLLLATKGMGIWRGGRRKLPRSKERSTRGYSIYSIQYIVYIVYSIVSAEYIIVRCSRLSIL